MQWYKCQVGLWARLAQLKSPIPHFLSQRSRGAFSQPGSQSRGAARSATYKRRTRLAAAGASATVAGVLITEARRSRLARIAICRGSPAARRVGTFREGKRNEVEISLRCDESFSFEARRFFQRSGP